MPLSVFIGDVGQLHVLVVAQRTQLTQNAMCSIVWQAEGRSQP